MNTGKRSSSLIPVVRVLRVLILRSDGGAIASQIQFKLDIRTANPHNEDRLGLRALVYGIKLDLAKKPPQRNILKKVIFKKGL